MILEMLAYVHALNRRCFNDRYTPHRESLPGPEAILPQTLRAHCESGAHEKKFFDFKTSKVIPIYGGWAGYTGCEIVYIALFDSDMSLQMD